MTFFQQPDKQQHIATQFLTEMFLTGVIYTLLGLIGFSGFLALLISALTAAHITLCIGIGKEVYDRAHPESHTADVMDIVADAIGVYAGVAASIAIPYLLQLSH